MRKKAAVLGVFSLFFLLASSAYGVRLEVPREYQTIQDAIDAAKDGDTIIVSRGTYSGAVVDKAVTLRARGNVIINAGPPFRDNSPLRAGFLFPDDYSGSGARIIGFRFIGRPQFGDPDDEMPDLPIYSRGANNVTMKHNIMINSLQAVTNWNGSGWKIKHNVILNLWTRNGGSIGILSGGFDGGSYGRNVITGNKVLGALKVYSEDGGGYDGTGIVLYADFRWGRGGALEIMRNRIHDNEISLVSDTPEVVDVNGIELTDTRDIPSPPVIFENHIRDNEIDGKSRCGIFVTRAPNNVFAENDIEDSTESDVFDDTTGDRTAGTANIWDDNDCS